MAKPSQHTSLGLTLLPILLWFTAMSSLSILRPSREPSGFGTSPLLGGSTHGPLSCRLFPRPPILGLFRCRFGLRQCLKLPLLAGIASARPSALWKVRDSNPLLIRGIFGDTAERRLARASPYTICRFASCYSGFSFLVCRYLVAAICLSLPSAIILLIRCFG